ncbi:hypothetical protein [Haloterrigena alkaliphila]|uniref:Uncharacterized protein n=1 Tax=Haloterrigena alkaliphila TaxID=2816475 RepID=A0A8A2V9P9_9EURY|nr:hypothetical protein [Haloterrigena alkaliphila]QSW97756.1 hypothetical protein J0X25_10015 [Haloterrigena alkaliphila]
MTDRTTWTVDHRGLARFPLRVAVTLVGMPWSVLLAFFVVAPLAVTGIVVAVGQPALRFAAVAWVVAILFVWFTSAGAARTEYALDPDARRLEIEQVGVETDHPLLSALGATPTIDLERVDSVGAISLPGTTVVTVSSPGVNLSEPTAFEVHDADRERVRAALEAAGLALPTGADGTLADRRSQYARGAVIVVGLGVTVVGPGFALGYHAIRGPLASDLGAIGLALAGLIGATAASRLASVPSSDEADGLGAGILIRAKRRLVVLVGVAAGMGAYLGAVVGLASLVS